MSDIDIVAIRESFTDYAKRDLQLSDELLTAVIKRAGKAWEAFEEADDPEKEACEFLIKAEQAASQMSIFDPGITSLIKKMDTTFHDEVRACIAAVSKGKTSAVDMYAQFRRIYTKDELDSMAHPGTEEGHVTGNQRPDKVKGKAANGTPITKIWTNDFVSAMPEGKEFENALDDVAKEVKATGSVPSLRGKSKQALAAIRSDMNTKRNALRSLVKRAIKLHHQWEAVQSMPLVDVMWIPGTKASGTVIPEGFGEGEDGDTPTLVTRAPRPIWINPKGNIAGGRDFSVTQLLAFDVRMALANGGTMADLTDTAGKGSDNDDNEEDTTGEAMADDEAQAITSMVVNFFSKVENKASVMKKIADRKKNADGADWLELVMEMDKIMHPIAEKNRNSYVAMQNAKMLNADNEAEDEA